MQENNRKNKAIVFIAIAVLFTSTLISYNAIWNQNSKPPNEIVVNETENLQLDKMQHEIEIALQNKGYYKGKIANNKNTKDAILILQQQSTELTKKIITKIADIKKQDNIIEKIQSISKQTQASEVITKIQTGLRNYGYDDLIVDGKRGEKTKTAIQRFQLDFGMKITGEPSQQVLDKLKEIGAFNQT